MNSAFYFLKKTIKFINDSQYRHVRFKIGVYGNMLARGKRDYKLYSDINDKSWMEYYEKNIKDYSSKIEKFTELKKRMEND